MSSAQYTCKDCVNASTCDAIGGKPSACCDFRRPSIHDRQKAIRKRAEEECLAELNAWRKEQATELRKRGEKPLAIHLLHGRDEADEEMTDTGYDGGFLFFDWVHIAYNSDLTFGSGNLECVPGRDTVLWLGEDLLVFHDGEKVQYFGDWEIVPASEVSL